MIEYLIPIFFMQIFNSVVQERKINESFEQAKKDYHELQLRLKEERRLQREKEQQRLQLEKEQQRLQREKEQQRLQREKEQQRLQREKEQQRLQREKLKTINRNKFSQDKDNKQVEQNINEERKGIESLKDYFCSRDDGWDSDKCQEVIKVPFLEANKKEITRLSHLIKSQIKELEIPINYSTDIDPIIFNKAIGINNIFLVKNFPKLVKSRDTYSLFYPIFFIQNLIIKRYGIIAEEREEQYLIAKKFQKNYLDNYFFNNLVLFNGEHKINDSEGISVGNAYTIVLPLKKSRFFLNLNKIVGYCIESHRIKNTMILGIEKNQIYLVEFGKIYENAFDKYIISTSNGYYGSCLYRIYCNDQLVFSTKCFSEEEIPGRPDLVLLFYTNEIVLIDKCSLKQFHYTMNFQIKDETIFGRNDHGPSLSKMILDDFDFINQGYIVNRKMYSFDNYMKKINKFYFFLDKGNINFIIMYCFLKKYGKFNWINQDMRGIQFVVDDSNEETFAYVCAYLYYMRQKKVIHILPNDFDFSFIEDVFYTDYLGFEYNMLIPKTLYYFDYVIQKRQNQFLSSYKDKTESLKNQFELENSKILASLKEKYNFVKWVNEFALYLFVKTFFADAIFQYHDTCLGKQTLDIYIPSIRTGIEYQGEQHFKPIDFFGGKEGFDYRKKLDNDKLLKCQTSNINLIYWNFDEEINYENLSKKIIGLSESRIELVDDKNINIKTSIDTEVFRILEEYKKTHPFLPKTQKKKKTRFAYIQYDSNGNYIAQYKSRKEASLKTKICDTSITYAINGKQQSAGGYLWKKIDILSEDIPPKIKTH